ncbi:Uncharacterized protein APZ42_011454 [Daphnia magna]|uniref:Uncharacterized protein n=1 Tax=Daphnia magna TaxID=35525 RepID=A0A162SP52_9CRUS|nr:Uncharacterized protein APZ42_011454 [Daphnia magna]
MNLLLDSTFKDSEKKEDIFSDLHTGCPWVSTGLCVYPKNGHVHLEENNSAMVDNHDSDIITEPADDVAHSLCFLKRPAGTS